MFYVHAEDIDIRYSPCGTHDTTARVCALDRFMVKKGHQEAWGLARLLGTIRAVSDALELILSETR